MANVINVVLHLVPALQGEDDRTGHVANVDERSLESTFIHDQAAILHRLVGEVVRHQVEPHPVAHAEGRRVAVGDAVAGLEDHLLGLGLGLAIERDRRSGRVLVADVVGHRSINASGRRENELLVGLPQPQERAGPFDVRRLSDVRFLLAGGIADDGRQVHDRLDAFERLGHGLLVADVPFLQLEKPVRAAGQEPMPAKLQGIEHAHAVPLVEQHGDKGRPDVAGSAGDEDSHGEPHPWCSRRAWCVIGLRDRVVGSFRSWSGSYERARPRPCGRLLVVLRCESWRVGLKRVHRWFELAAERDASSFGVASTVGPRAWGRLAGVAISVNSTRLSTSLRESLANREPEAESGLFKPQGFW